MGEGRPDAEETIPEPDKKVGMREESTVYLWIVPARVEGEWTFELSSGGKARRTRLALQQRFQFVSGTVELTGQGDVAVSHGRLRGEELRLTLPPGALDRGPVGLVGRVEGDSLSGPVRSADRAVAQWNAHRRN